MTSGDYRLGDWAYVSFDGEARTGILRKNYEALGYMPPFAELPNKAEFEARRNSGAA
jgi:hypothetical protein